ncbi:hypothetical protein SCUCBS95973_000383 [Sporothrix curviconia]|uniref:C6 zinc finger domain containing protein n=1 Tax=Sporothrix curviconia TaxID=1260050 RepID=A0ABP0APX5_9PEZI
MPGRSEAAAEAGNSLELFDWSFSRWEDSGNDDSDDNGSGPPMPSSSRLRRPHLPRASPEPSPEPSPVACRPRPLTSDVLHQPVTHPDKVPEMPKTNPYTLARPQLSLPPANDVEEALSSAFVRASCRVNEAAGIMTSLCSTLVNEWTGLKPRQYAAATTIALAGHISNIDNMASFTPHPGKPNLLVRFIAYLEGTATESQPQTMTPDAVLLWTIMSCMQLQVAMAGAVAGLVIDARAAAVRSGQLRRLSAFEPIGYRNHNAMSIYNANRLSRTFTDASGSHQPTSRDFSAFTGGVTTNTDLDRFVQEYTNLCETVQYLKGNTQGTQVHEFADPLLGYLETTVNRLADLRSKALAFKNSAECADASGMRYLLQLAMLDVCHAAYSTKMLHPLVARIIAWKRKWNTPSSYLKNLCLLSTSEEAAEGNMLEQSKPIVDQSVSLATTVNQRINNSVLPRGRREA